MCVGSWPAPMRRASKRDEMREMCVLPATVPSYSFQNQGSTHPVLSS